MTISEIIREIRIKSLLSQEAFAKELNVSFATVNRWEKGRAKPNMSKMREIKKFCEINNIDFAELENEWLKTEVE